MARWAGVFVQSVICHLHNRVGRGEALFRPEEEAERFWNLLHEAKERDVLSVLAWRITTNHDHAKARPDPGLVSARDLLGVVAIERWGIGVRALAEALGKSRDRVSLWVRRGASRRSKDHGFGVRLDEVDGRLAASLGP